MVGIVVVSHGSVAEAILASAAMVLGPQRNVAFATLESDMGPDDFRMILEGAIDSLEEKDEVLFLVDLWGGTPFNQVSALVEERECWVAVTRLNLPMLIVAYTERRTKDTAAALAREVAEQGRKGVRIKPTKLDV